MSNQRRSELLPVFYVVPRALRDALQGVGAIVGDFKKARFLLQLRSGGCFAAFSFRRSSQEFVRHRNHYVPERIVPVSDVLAFLPLHRCQRPSDFDFANSDEFTRALVGAAFRFTDHFEISVDSDESLPVVPPLEILHESVEARAIECAYLQQLTEHGFTPDVLRAESDAVSEESASGSSFTAEGAPAASEAPSSGL